VFRIDKMAAGSAMLKDRLRQHELQLFPLFGSCLDLPEDNEGETFQALDLSFNASTQQELGLVTQYSINSKITRSVTMVTVKSEPLESQELSYCAKRKAYPATYRNTTRSSTYIRDDGNGRAVPIDTLTSEFHSHIFMDNIVSQKAKASFQKAVAYSRTHARGGVTSVSSGQESTSSHTYDSKEWPAAPVSKTLNTTSITPCKTSPTSLTTPATTLTTPASTAATRSTFVTPTTKSASATAEQVSTSTIVRLSDYISTTLHNMSTMPSESDHSTIRYTGCHNMGQQADTCSLYDYVRNGVLGVTQFHWCHICNSFCWRPEVDLSAHAQCKIKHSTMGERARPAGCMTQHRKFGYVPGYVVLNCSLCGKLYTSVNVFRYHMSVDHRMYMYSQS
jgi:hypothetical protein